MRDDTPERRLARSAELLHARLMAAALKRCLAIIFRR
jgi:hypothetical protein